MALVNVNGSDDPAYRYKMPAIVTKVEGSGNGIKTVMVNMTEVAEAIHRDPLHVTKFLGVERGAQSRFESKVRMHIVPCERAREREQYAF